jgi:hypothetical protein
MIVEDLVYVKDIIDVEGQGCTGGSVNMYNGEEGQLRAYIESIPLISNPAIVNNIINTAIAITSNNILFSIKVLLFLYTNVIVIHNATYSY